MDETIIEAGQQQDAETAAAQTEPTESQHEPEQSAAGEADGKADEAQTLTPEKVNEIIRERLERQLRGIYDRYGVSDEKGLDDLIELAKGHDALQAERDELSKKVSELTERLLFIQNGISPEREDDVRTYFKGKGIEMSEEALKQCISTHPEWTGRQTQRRTFTPKPIGNAEAGERHEETEREKAERLFGMRFIN